MDVEAIIKTLLDKRGVKDVDLFLNPSYEDMADPFLLPDMGAAVTRISDAHTNSEKVAVYGDYDVDGMTATTVLTESFRAMGLDVVNFIPSRFIDGYGLGERGILELKSQGVKLIVTVDTGSIAYEHIDFAGTHGLDVIVTDHHNIGDRLPSAVAVINPKRADSDYPFRDLAGVGVAFGLVRALQTKLTGLDPGQEKWLLDLVALGTVCDVVPLQSENRTLAYWGLHVAKQSRRPGIAELVKVAKISLNELDSRSFGFGLGPRLNASGRLDTAKNSMDLLSCDSVASAETLARELDKQNTARRKIQKDVYDEASLLAKKQNGDIIVVAGRGWSHGVVGIVAAKLVEDFKRPAFVLGIEDDGTATGSARSFGEYNPAVAIKEAGELVIKGGGHAAAAGMTIKEENIDSFRSFINNYYSNLSLSEQQLANSPVADMELANFELVGPALVDRISLLEPFGEGNPVPLFKVKAFVKSWRAVGADGVHAKVDLQDADSRVVSGIGFGLAKKVSLIEGEAEALFTLGYNHWNGRKSVQLQLVDIFE